MNETKITMSTATVVHITTGNVSRGMPIATYHYANREGDVFRREPARYLFTPGQITKAGLPDRRARGARVASGRLKGRPRAQYAILNEGLEPTAHTLRAEIERLEGKLRAAKEALDNFYDDNATTID